MLIFHLRLTVLQEDVYNKLMQLLVLKLALTDCWLYLPGINILKVKYTIYLPRINILKVKYKIYLPGINILKIKNKIYLPEINILKI